MGGTMKAVIWRSGDRLQSWLLLDGLYLLLLFALPIPQPPKLEMILPAHLAGIAVGTLVMYTGVGAGVV
jgi:hypothetical protein